MESMKISDYMNVRPVIFREEMPIEQAVERLVQTNQPGGPVVGRDRKVVGFLSQQDCMQTMLKSVYHNEQLALVKEVMKKDVLSLKPYGSVFELAEQMLGDKPKLYPVVDDNGKLVGTISRTEVLTAIDAHLLSSFHAPA